MKKQHIVFSILLGLFLCPMQSFGQATDDVTGMREIREKKWSLSGSADATMFQMALLELGNEQSFSTPRYSGFFNTGFHLNRRAGRNFTIFTGLNVKNLGLIYRKDTLIQKYRSYTIGAPLGFKIGTLGGEYLLIGGGIDIPFHSKKKQWTKGDRSTKVKSSEWFSDEVNSVLTYGFLGYRFPNTFTAKLYYYPTNYWSDTFVPGNRSNIFMLSVGFDIGGGKKTKGLKVPPVKRKSTSSN